MIDRLEPHDPPLEDVLVLVQVPEELELRGRRPHDEDLIGIAERVRDIVEEAGQVVGVMVLFRRTLRMATDVTAGRADRRLVEALGVDVENARFLVIDPHSGLEMGGHRRAGSMIRASWAGASEQAAFVESTS